MLRQLFIRFFFIATFSVHAQDATLDAPATSEAGKIIEVAWTGPNANGDYLSVAQKGAPPTDYIRYK
jgi:hypothetical protein